MPAPKFITFNFLSAMGTRKFQVSHSFYLLPAPHIHRQRLVVRHGPDREAYTTWQSLAVKEMARENS